MRSAGGANSAPPGFVTRATKSMIADFAAPSFQEASGWRSTMKKLRFVGVTWDRNAFECQIMLTGSTHRREARMQEHLEVISAVGLGLGLAMAFVQGAAAQENPVTAIDIALEPDATMVQHAMDANARLRKSFPKGFALDETHHPHISMLQQFVRTDDLDKVFAAANAVMAKEKPTAWTLKAFKYYYIPSPPLGLAGIVVEPTEDLHRLQDELITAVAPYTVKTGAPAAFFSDEGGRDIQKSLIDYVANFVT